MSIDDRLRKAASCSLVCKYMLGQTVQASQVFDFLPIRSAAYQMFIIRGIRRGFFHMIGRTTRPFAFI